MRALRPGQLTLFRPPPKTADELLDERFAARTRERMARERTRPDDVAGVRCTSCGRGNFADVSTCRSCGEELAPNAPPASREQLRALSKLRDRPVRPTTVSTKMMRREAAGHAAVAKALDSVFLTDGDELVEIKRPVTRADCDNVPRPCPFVSCPHHLYLDISARTGALRLVFPDIEPGEMDPSSSCELDIAERDGETLEEVGRAMNLTRERVRQIEVKALAKLDATTDLAALREFYGAGVGTKRRLPMLDEEHQEKRDDSDPEASDDFDAAQFAGPELDDV